MENRAAEIIHETRKNMKKNPGKFQEHDTAYIHHPAVQQSQKEAEMLTHQEIQLKASRDVRWPLCSGFSYDGKCANWIPIFCTSF